MTRLVLKACICICRLVTRLWLHGEVGLPLQDGVDELGVVSKHGIISICGCHLGHRGPCRGEDGDHTVRVSSGSSSSRRGNKVIMPQSRRVCLSGSEGGALEMEEAKGGRQGGGRVRGGGCWQRRVGGGGAAPAFHSSVRLCRCVRQPPQPYSDVSLAIHLPLNFSPSHSDSVPPLYLSHLPPFFSPPTVSFSSPCLATISSSLSLSAPLVFIILFFSPFFPESTLSFLSHGRGFISYFQSNLPPFHFPLFPESNALWFIISEILRRKKQITYKLKW